MNDLKEAGPGCALCFIMLTDAILEVFEVGMSCVQLS
jgi:hypothetical protein